MEILATPERRRVRSAYTMEDRIKIPYDEIINGYVVTMPDFVTLKMIEEWKVRFEQKLKTLPSSSHCALLFDTGKHNFESIQCLKSLREYLSDDALIKSCVTRAALVAPANCVVPSEAYIDNIDVAYQWLFKNNSTEQTHVLDE